MQPGNICKVRTEVHSEALRDDDAAFSVSAISNSLLFTTSRGFCDEGVARMAWRHLVNDAGAIMRINEAMPQIVANELHMDSHQVQDGVIEATREVVGWP